MNTYYMHSSGEVEATRDCPGVDVYCNPRPVVLIDPEDREQIERLTKVLAETYMPGYNWEWVQAALRSLIAPPKPPEPIGLGAVVEDADGLRWTRVESGETITRNPWYPAADDERQPDEYRNIAAVKVLSDGVTR